MDYGDTDGNDDLLGASIFISHPFRKHSPFLFRGIVDSFSRENRKDRYRKFYEPLAQHNISKCDSTSTVYMTNIEMCSDLYDEVYHQEKDLWLDEHLVTIRRLKPKKYNNHTINAESWFYLSRLSNSSSFESGTAILESSLRNTMDNFKPTWHAKGDISKVDCLLNLNLDDRMICDTIEINMIGPFDLKAANVMPDSITFCKIFIFNTNKINTIQKEGMRFYAEFPESSKLQNVRLAILLIILPILLTLIFRVSSLEFAQIKHDLINR